MSDIGHKSRECGKQSPPAKRGRPRKDPELVLREKEEELKIRDQKIRELLDRAVELFEIPYDDRDERPPDAPTISYVAEEMVISVVIVLQGKVLGISSGKTSIAVIN